jgi:O-succinylbenzoate synthase
MYRTKTLDLQPNLGKVYDESYKIPGFAAETRQSVRCIVQNPRICGRIRAKCTMNRTKASNLRPTPGKVYDGSYKILESAAESGQSVRFIVQNPRICGRIWGKCTMNRTKSQDLRPNPRKVYDGSYKNLGFAAESAQSVRRIVQKPWICGRIRAKCTMDRTKP